MSAFSMRKDIQHPHRHAHIYKETDHIVGDLDERSCGESRVDFQFFERQRHEGTENRCSAIVVQGLANGRLELKEFWNQIWRGLRVAIINAVVIVGIDVGGDT